MTKNSKSFPNIEDNQPFTFCLIHEKTRTDTFQLSFLFQVIIHVFHQFLKVFYFKLPMLPNVIAKKSPVNLQVSIFFCVRLELYTTSNIRSRSPQKDATNFIQKDFRAIFFGSVSGQFSLKESLDTSQLVIIFLFL